MTRPNPTTRRRATRRGRPAGGFTLTELFVVLLIGAIVVSISVPAFQNLIESAERSGAENAVRVAVTVAQDAATREGLDSAAVFLQDEGGRTRIVTVVKVGTFEEEPQDPFAGSGGGGGGGAQPGFLAGGGIEREVFAPLPGASVIELPDGYSVRGYVPAGALLNRSSQTGTTPDWYDIELYGGDDDTDDAKLQGNWVAPLSGSYEVDLPGGAIDANAAGTPRHSFMIRFEGGTGLLMSSTAPALVVDPRPSNEGIETIRISPTGSYRETWWRVDRAESVYDWARAVITRSAADAWGQPRENQRPLRSQLIGTYSNDTVLAGPVTRIAVYRETDLATDIGASGVNDITGTIFEPYDKDGNLTLDTGPAATQTYDGEQRRFRRGVLQSRGTANIDDIRRHINAWIEGDTNGNGELDPTADQNAVDSAPASRPWERRPDAAKSIVFVVDRLSGELREVNR